MRLCRRPESPLIDEAALAPIWIGHASGDGQIWSNADGIGAFGFHFHVPVRTQFKNSTRSGRGVDRRQSPPPTGDAAESILPWPAAYHYGYGAPGGNRVLSSFRVCRQPRCLRKLMQRDVNRLPGTRWLRIRSPVAASLGGHQQTE